MRTGWCEQVLAALDHLYCPVAPTTSWGRSWKASTASRWHQPTWTACSQTSGAPSTLAQRPIWLCVGICPDLRGDTDYWARSDWAPWVRVVLPDSWLVREYWLVRQLWRALPEDPSTRPSPLVDLLVRKAKLLPVKEVERVRRWSRRNDPHYDSARDRFSIWGNIVAEDLFDMLASENRQRCQQVADELVKLDQRAQLYGIA